MARKDIAQNDLTARGRATSGTRSKAVHPTPMAHQRPDDHGASSTQQRLVRLVGCYDPQAQEERAAPSKRKPARSRPRYRITVTE
jgi:hypothetical protein